jgi:hypothetical protein
MQIRPMTRVLAVAVAIVSLAVTALAPLPALADGPVTLRLRLGSRCVSGHKTTQDPITVKLLHSDGSVIQTRHDDTTDLEWRVCFSSTHVPVNGNKIRLIHWTVDRTVGVPDLTIALDRVTNVVRGHAPAGKAIELDYESCDAMGRCTEEPPVPATANAQGRYQQDLSPIDIDGSDLVRALYTNPHDDLFYRDGQAPFMTIKSPNKVSLSCLSAGTTTVRLLDTDGTLRSSLSFHTSGACKNASGAFRRSGEAVNIHVGDRILSSFASDAKMTWPGVSVAAHDTSYSVRCFPETDWYLTIRNKEGTLKGSYSGTTDADGRFVQHAGYQHIKPGWTVRVACESRPGDRVTASATAS